MSGEPRLQNIELGDLVSTLEHLSQRGIRQEHFKRLRSDRGFTRRVVRAILEDAPKKGPISVEEARRIGVHILFGVEDWEKHFGLEFTEEELAQLSSFPWGEDVLDECRPGSTTLAESGEAFIGLTKLGGRPLTISEWIARESSDELQFSYPFNKERDPFVKAGPIVREKTCRFGWYFVTQISPQPKGDRNFLVWDEVRQDIPAPYQPLSAIEHVTQLMLRMKKYGKHSWDQFADTHSDFFLCADGQRRGERVRLGVRRFHAVGKGDTDFVYELQFKDEDENRIYPFVKMMISRKP